MPNNISEVGRNVFFDNPFLLVERVELNKVGLPLVRARAAARPITVEGLPKPVDVDGPSMFFTWWPNMGTPPHPGEWIELQQVRVLTMEELVDPEGETTNHPKDTKPIIESEDVIRTGGYRGPLDMWPNAIDKHPRLYGEPA